MNHWSSCWQLLSRVTVRATTNALRVLLLFHDARQFEILIIINDFFAAHYAGAKTRNEVKHSTCSMDRGCLEKPGVFTDCLSGLSAEWSGVQIVRAADKKSE